MIAAPAQDPAPAPATAPEHHAHDAVVEGLPPLVVGEILEGPLSAGPDGVDEHVELASTLCQLLGSTVEDSLGATDDGHSSPVVGQAARGGQSHSATAADHDGVRVP